MVSLSHVLQSSLGAAGTDFNNLRPFQTLSFPSWCPYHGCSNTLWELQAQIRYSSNLGTLQNLILCLVISLSHAQIQSGISRARFQQWGYPKAHLGSLSHVLKSSVEAPAQVSSSLLTLRTSIISNVISVSHLLKSSPGAAGPDLAIWIPNEESSIQRDVGDYILPGM